MFPLRDRKILLGVTGSVAAFKAAALASKLTQAGARVTALLTPAATRFVSPLLFRALTGQPAYVDDDLWGPEGHILHVDLAREADALVIMPATADMLARLAHGRGDGLIPLAALAMHGKPLVVVPAMDVGMYTHPATQANVQQLQARGVHVVGPVEGRLASGAVGPGRMVEPEHVLAFLRFLFSREGPLAGRRVLVTAGPTQEPIDPVRVLTNRSSGRQGFALAQAALDAGAEVTLVTGPVSLPTPYGAERVDVTTAAEMYDAVMAALPQTDMLFKAAAVADYRPAEVAGQKIKKTHADLTLRLTRTRDILAAVRAYRAAQGRPEVVIGFAAESRLDPSALRAKLHDKGVDILAANDITAPDAGFQVPTNRLRLLYAHGPDETWPLWPKDEVARQLLMRALH
ncbi:MAG: bifunctional phosphopantothenoylcysteine decarboxylase/phosphopantothenate--cysteine ligase CoaBC, partial [Chloroflexi bacterium]|nr:bifunctional phosphopantothenoylcysteine decarboxylase/phosphopantothenate--cysteine ligase CoaBC [Chloroflexota bacterium]